jgi:hypothetical protein
MAYAQQAGARGVLPVFARALREINDKLETDPLGWGDPNYRLRNLGLLMCLGPHPFLFVYYGVDEQRRVVYIKGFHPAPGSPLMP